MPPTAPSHRAVRRRRPYSEFFRELSPDERHQELERLRKLYDEDRMSIRQIAELKRSSYGFMQGRLVEAGVSIGANRPPASIELVASAARRTTS